MSPSMRTLGVAALVVALVAGVVWVRHYVARTQSATVPRSTTVAVGERERPTFAPRRARDSLGFSDSNAAPEWPTPATHSPLAATAAKAPFAAAAGATKPATGASAAADGRASTAAADGNPIDAQALPGSDGSFSVSFDGSTAAADQTTPVISDGVEPDPNGGAALFPPAAVLAYPNAGGVNPEEGTIALWVRRESDPTDEKGRALVELRTATWENRIEFGMGPRYVRFLLTTSDGVEFGVGAGVSWAKEEWHHVAATWGQALAVLYVDGAQRDQRTYDGTVAISPSALLYVASTRSGPDPNAAPVSLRGLVILQHAATPDEIEAIVTRTAPPAG